jgi:ribonuclease T2
MLVSGDLVASLLGLLPLERQTRPALGPASSSCTHPGLSCPPKAPSNPDTCCLNFPSGHFLLTQFWDASPALGPSDQWTEHGLWPDYCSGGFDQFCDKDREHSSISALLESSSPHLLSYMNDHWLSLNGDNNHLWAHEWNKHGTCISSLEQKCYGSADETADLEAVTSYFTHAATLYASLNTYATLSKAGITPSHEHSYALSDLQDAVSAAHGHEVTLRCHGDELNEIWYHYLVRGPLRHAQPFNASTAAQSATVTDIFVPTKPDVAKSNCPAHGIRYLPKTATSRPTHTRPHHSHPPTSSSEPSGPTTPFEGRGHLVVRPLSSSSSTSTFASQHKSNKQHKDTQHALGLTAEQAANDPRPPIKPCPSSLSLSHGCLIRGGLWYTSGSCATYLAKSDPPHLPADIIATDDNNNSSQHLFTLSSLYAPCAVVSPDARFTCANDLGVQAIFEAVNSTRGGDTREVLAWKGNTVFYASDEPGRFQKVELFADDDAGKRKVQVEISWEGI